MDIQTKDGILLRNIPDGTPEEVIKARLAQIRGGSIQESPKEEPKETGFFDDMSIKNVPQNLANLAAGAVRGAGSIGSSILLPIDMINAAIEGAGTTGAKANTDNRKAGIDAGLKIMGADPESGLYGFGKLAAEIAGTAGAGDALALGAAASNMPRLAAALKSGGFNLGSKDGGALERMAIRTIGGAGAGGTQAAMIDPNQAKTGAIVGGVMPVAVKGAYGVGKGITSGAKSLVDPLYEGGRNTILGKALINAAGNQSDDALRNLQSAKPLIKGSQPTAGMAANNPGIAALERAAMANNPIATNELALRQAANNEARTAALENIIPNRELAQEARTVATQSLYNKSATSAVKATPELTTLLQRPSMQAAVQRASKLADEAGEVFDLNNMTGKSAQYIKMALDDMASSAPMTGIGGNELRSIQSTRQAYLDELGKQIPEYLEANKQYAALSAPLTQSDVLSDIHKKGADFKGNFTPAAFSRALSDRTAQSVTGKATATLESTLTPSQLAILNNIKQDLLNQDFANTAGRGVGSNTVQNLANSNMVESFGIPTALRNSTLGGVVGNVMSRAGDVVYGKANKQLSQELAEALLDHKKAAEIMQKASQSPKNRELARLLTTSLSRAAPVVAVQQQRQ